MNLIDAVRVGFNAISLVSTAIEENPSPQGDQQTEELDSAADVLARFVALLEGTDEG